MFWDLSDMSEEENEGFSGRDYKGQITLCVFPHLLEVVAIDTRGAQAEVITIEIREILDEAFQAGLRTSFEELLESSDLTLSSLSDIPQQLEATIKIVVLRRVIEIIDARGHGEINNGMLGVLFFSGDILWVSSDKWRSSLGTMFEDKMTDDELDSLFDKLEQMVEEERNHQKSARKAFVKEVVTSGDERGYVTLWEKGRESSN